MRQLRDRASGEPYLSVSHLCTAARGATKASPFVQLFVYMTLLPVQAVKFPCSLTSTLLSLPLFHVFTLDFCFGKELSPEVMIPPKFIKVWQHKQHTLAHFELLRSVRNELPTVKNSKRGR